jgi:prolyl-tRNA editing enzyme YbaK/EbsC (Cys-tRNA(Pro) deacylase)
MLTDRDLAAVISAMGLDAEVIRLDTVTPTVEAAAHAVGCTPDRIAKSILFLVEGRPVIAVACGPARVDPRRIAAHLGVSRKRVRLADAATVLSVTGYPIGALPPFGHRQPVLTLLDRELMRRPEVYAGGGSQAALVRLRPTQLQSLTGAPVIDLVAASSETPS